MVERRVIAVAGIVQGVGFRPYVHRLAVANALAGIVRNVTAGVLIDVEGEADRLDEFCRLLPLAPPALARVASVRVTSAPTREYDGFRIATSERHASAQDSAVIPADAATCDACRAELFNPSTRRHAHPFINCTDCGPRFTIVLSTPYDRERTTMADFPMCTRCRSEYDDLADRRFHAEAIACPDCGPRLVAHGIDSASVRHTGTRALDAAAAMLLASGIVAIQSLGGFQLAADATDDGAVTRLRARKQRPGKPFAVMVHDAAAAAALCTVSTAERAALESAARPVVLLQRRPDARLATSIAPGLQTLGVMLPSTPVHHLLLAMCRRPLVMTSGNRSGAPVVIDAAHALAELGDIADLFLVHDRPIAARCDDSVVRIVAGEARLARRARGFVPHAIALPVSSTASVLAFGGHSKNTVCLAHGSSAHLSAHVADLDGVSARHAMQQAIATTVGLAGAQPLAVAHDMHPDYASTSVARTFADEHDISVRVAVQHHHAHVAACVAEHGVTEPVIGVVFDGAGLGTDGAIWGGEFLTVHGAVFTRCGHLGYVPLPGGDAAARRPWCSAAAHASCAGLEEASSTPPIGVDVTEWRMVQQLLDRRVHAPNTSSAGRLFDAVASLLGLCHVATFEGEAAMRLESAAGTKLASGYGTRLTTDTAWIVDAAPIIRGVVHDQRRGRDCSEIAAAFHASLRDVIVLGCERIREECALATVVLSGGVFMNARLAETAHEALVTHGFRVLLPGRVPCNDGGLALGQAWVATCALREDLCA